MSRLSFAILLCCCVALSCRPKKELSYDAKIAASVTKAGLQVPTATGPTVPIPEAGVFVFFFRDHLALESPTGFAYHSDPAMALVDAGVGVIVLPIDARAATDGADAKYRRNPKDPYIVPLANAITSHFVDGAPKRVILASGGQPPPQLSKDVAATFTELGVTESYRLVRTKDGKIAAERTP